MSYNIIASENFKKEAKRLIKKYASLKNELAALETGLGGSPSPGTSIGRNCYKIRLKVKSKGKGKSGGMRVITLVMTLSKNIHLLSIYDKSEKEDIADKELLHLINTVKK